MRRSSSTTGPTWATRWSCTTDACRALISAEHQGRAGTEGFRPALSCLWPRWCSGRRRARPPARLGDRAALGAASRSPPVPSGPSGALHTGGACGSGVLGPRRRPPAPRQVPPVPSTPAAPVVLVCPARPRRRPWALQLMLTNFARNSPVTLSNLECASLELQRFQRLLKLPSNELRATFPGLAVYQDPWQPVGAIVRPGPRYRRAIPMCLGAIVGVFVHRYETDSTFASTSLQRNETVIAFASDERPFWGISTLQRCCRFQWGAQCGLQRCCRFQLGRAAWCAKVLAVSKPPSSRPVHEKVRPARPRVGVSAKKFALHAQNGRKTPFSGALGEYFRGSAAGRSAVGEYFRGRAAEGPHSERVYVRPQSLRRPLISRGQISHAIPFKAFQMLNSDR